MASPQKSFPFFGSCITMKWKKKSMKASGIQDVMYCKYWIQTCFDAILPLHIASESSIFPQSHMYLHKQIYAETSQVHVSNIIRSSHYTVLSTQDNSVLFNQHQTMNLWGKELQVCHLCKVTMATPQQTLDRTRVFPINAFFPLLDEWESALCSRWPWRCCFWIWKITYFRHYSYPHAWCKQGAKSLCRHIEVKRRTGQLHLSSDEDYFTHCSSSQWIFACLQYMPPLTTSHYSARQ